MPSIATSLDISVVIPTFNMSAFLLDLWASLHKSGVLDIAREIVVVNDGSTDRTREVLNELAGGPRGEFLRLVHMPKNVGRFRARLEGAKVAQSERILFLDTRLVLPDNFGERLAAVAKAHRSVMGHVDIDITRNVFCLYWDRSHRFIFRRHFQDSRRVLTLTKDNYDLYLKGTGVLLCERELFLKTSAKYGDLFSDDTLLMKDMVATTPIVLCPDVRIQWVPRENARDFIARIWDRGPGFVEYHVLEHRGRFFWIVFAGGLVFVSLVGFSLAVPPVAPLLAGGALVVTAASTALFAKSVREAVRMAPLHVAVVATFGASILRGLAVNAQQQFERRYCSKTGRTNRKQSRRRGYAVEQWVGIQRRSRMSSHIEYPMTGNAIFRRVLSNAFRR
ncbi:MAG: glycosyltransferase [Polyangiaceae bacterium]|nr:glycosyltransferase [Polyangiaceae bacterium]